MTNGTGTKGTGLAPNVASLLCYICSPITSVIFMLLEKENKDVQFHAWQSLGLFVALMGAYLVVNILSAIVGAIAAFLGMLVGFLNPIIGLTFFVLWILCLVKAYQGERWKVPYIGDFAEKKAMGG